MSHPSKTSTLLKVLNQHDSVVKEILEKADEKVSCKRGCTHCCYMLTSIHMLEGRLIAEELMSRPHWRRVAKSLSVAAHQGLEVHGSRNDYLKAKIPCPLLDLDTKDCTVYDVRPSVCRNYFVASPPEKCAPEYDEPDVRIFNTNMLVATALKFCVDVSGGQMVVAPIPLMVLWCMSELVNSKEKRKFFSELTEGLPDPGEWTATVHERVTEYKAEDTTPSQKAQKEAFDQVFGRNEPSM